MLPVVPKKGNKLLTRLHYFVVETLSTYLLSAPPQPPGEAWELGWEINHNIGKIVGTRVDNGVALARNLQCWLENDILNTARNDF